MPSRDRTDQEIFETLQAAEAVAQRLRALMGSVGADFVSTQFYARIRVKSYDSIVKKIYARRREPQNELYSFYDITDLVGFRIVTLYDDDIKKAVDHLLKLIEDSSNVDQALFKPFKPPQPDKISWWDYIREANFIRRMRRDETKDTYETEYDRIVARLDKDMRGNRVALRHHKKKLDLRTPKNEGYSSIHFVVNARGKIYDREIDIPIEVQIRTAAEDIWGEINHQLVYKMKDLYVWTPNIEQTYSEMEKDSRSIKSQLYDLADPITRLFQHSSDAGRLIQEFKNPTTPYHNSLIVTLFYAISSKFFDNVDEKLRMYNDTLMDLTKIVDPSKDAEAAEMLLRCVTFVNDVRAKFGETFVNLSTAREKSAPTDHPSIDNDLVLLKQRMLLCELEIARLKALSVIRFRYRLNSRTEKIQQGDYKDEVRGVFDKICDIRNSRDLKIRPIAMMSFWKYIIGREIDRQLGIYHLRAAADELAQDSSLPEWSIYRILIPRYFAAELYAEAQRLVRDNGTRSEREVWWRSQVAIDVRNMLTRAFELALDSYTKHIRRDRRAGDLVFGLEPNEGIRDADVLANVMSLYFVLFDSPDYERLGATPQFIAERVEEVYEFFTSLEPLHDSEKRRTERRIERLRKLLDLLAADAARPAGR